MKSGKRLDGRVRFSAAEHARLLGEYHRSGLTQREFVSRHGLSLATLTLWLRRERQPMKETGNISFAEMGMPALSTGPRWALEIVRPGGVTVRVAHEAPSAWVEQLLGAC